VCVCVCVNSENARRVSLVASGRLKRQRETACVRSTRELRALKSASVKKRAETVSCVSFGKFAETRPT